MLVGIYIPVIYVYSVPTISIRLANLTSLCVVISDPRRALALSLSASLRLESRASLCSELSLARRFRSLFLLLRSAASLADESMADESMADEFKAEESMADVEESMADNTIPWCMAIIYYTCIY